MESQKQAFHPSHRPWKSRKSGISTFPPLRRRARAVQVLRHLRQIYPDPITGTTQWGLIRLPDGGIVGVYSLSQREPLQRSSLGWGLSFPAAKTYRDWRFIAPSAGELLAPAQ